MKKNFFIVELIKSPPFRILVILALLIILGVMISNRKHKAIQLKEDVLYIQPKTEKK
jgi:hypothetical protein